MYAPVQIKEEIVVVQHSSCLANNIMNLVSYEYYLATFLLYSIRSVATCSHKL